MWKLLKTSTYVVSNTIVNSTYVELPIDKLDQVTDKESAKNVISDLMSSLTKNQKSDMNEVDKVLLFAEESMSRATSQSFTGYDVEINTSELSNAVDIVNETKAATEDYAQENNIDVIRDMFTVVNFKSDVSDKLNVSLAAIDSSLALDGIRVENSEFNITIPGELAKSTDLNISVEKVDKALVSNFLLVSASNDLALLALLMQDDAGSSYKVTFDKTLDQNVKISLPSLNLDKEFQVVVDDTGKLIGGKYNPITNLVEFKTKTGGTFKIIESKKDFSDILTKSAEMQKAIAVLTSKGIINGTSETTFSPDKSITRAEIATVIVKALAKYSLDLSCEFDDVGKSDWYYASVASAKNEGLMAGTSKSVFSPNVVIQKDQMLTVAVNTLVNEMRYKFPTANSELLSVYADQSDIANWSSKFIALATRENLVVKRTDNHLKPSVKMTRGDAAIILYRMFNKIW